MKNLSIQLSVVLIAFVALTFLMSYARPAEEAPKEYMVVHQQGGISSFERFEKEVNQKIAEGWHLQGGVAMNNGVPYQPMVK